MHLRYQKRATVHYEYIHIRVGNIWVGDSAVAKIYRDADFLTRYEDFLLLCHYVFSSNPGAFSMLP
jgi:hypothetical protein